LRDKIVNYCLLFIGAPLAVLHQQQEAAPPSSAIACRFFALGSCKFGNKCRFHHSQQVRTSSDSEKQANDAEIKIPERPSTVIKTEQRALLPLQVHRVGFSPKEGN